MYVSGGPAIQQSKMSTSGRFAGHVPNLGDKIDPVTSRAGGRLVVCVSRRPLGPHPRGPVGVFVGTALSHNERLALENLTTGGHFVSSMN